MEITLRPVQMVVAAVVIVLLGFMGALAGKSFTHHNEQHWNLEQALLRQDRINNELIAAINQLAARK